MPWATIPELNHQTGTAGRAGGTGRRLWLQAAYVEPMPKRPSSVAGLPALCRGSILGGRKGQVVGRAWSLLPTIPELVEGRENGALVSNGYWLKPTILISIHSSASVYVETSFFSILLFYFYFLLLLGQRTFFIKTNQSISFYVVLYSVFMVEWRL